MTLLVVRLTAARCHSCGMLPLSSTQLHVIRVVSFSLKFLRILNFYAFAGIYFHLLVQCLS